MRSASDVILFAAGGSGGHLYAAQSVAQALQEKVGVEPIFASSGVNQGLSSDGFTYCHLDSPPLSFKNPFKFALRLLKGTWKAVRLIRKTKPIACVGFGSYHSVTALIGAALTRTPIVLFESNVMPGKVIRLFAKSALFTAAALPLKGLKGWVRPVYFKAKHGKLELEAREAKKQLGLDPDRFTFLVFGGSQGARLINELMLKVKGGAFQVIHLVGKNADPSALKEHYQTQGIKAYVRTFCVDMAPLYAAAEACVSRSGALSLLEQIEYEKPSILIPFARASQGHQQKNAYWMCERIGGSKILLESEVTGEKLAQALTDLAQDKSGLARMKAALRAYKAGQDLPTLDELMIEHFKLRHYVFAGIGGIGMSALAHVLLDKGQSISGFDGAKSAITDSLCKRGAHISIGCDAPLERGSVVIASSAIAKDHPIREKAKEKGLPIWHRSELLKQVMQTKKVIAVAGTHGKTSTSGLLAFLMTKLGFCPSFAVGGEFNAGQAHGRWDKGQWCVLEADESDGSFLNYSAMQAIITNLEVDHLDYWKNEAALQAGFKQFIRGVERPFYCADDPGLSKLNIDGISYGKTLGADLQLVSIHAMEGGQQFSFRYKGKVYEAFFLPLFGEHQVINALPCIGMCLELGSSEEAIREAMKSFSGMKKRLEFLGEHHGVRFYKDYAHHPTATLATLKALRQQYKDRPITCLYQPHRFSRMPLFLERDSSPFIGADRCVLFEVFAAGEKAQGASSRELLEQLKNWGHKACEWYPDMAAFNLKAKAFKSGDVVVMMGAGSIHNWAGEIIASV